MRGEGKGEGGWRVLILFTRYCMSGSEKIKRIHMPLCIGSFRVVSYDTGGTLDGI